MDVNSGSVHIVDDVVYDVLPYLEKKESKEEVDKRVDEIAKTLGVEDLLDKYPAQCSGGEKQRIAISRLFLKNAPILVLDEATSYADAENEQLINKALTELSKGKTVVMIAHKMSSIKEADQIIVLDKGKNIASGTDAQLMESSKLYRHLWEEYLKGSNWTIEGRVER